jgi:nucleotide-binding universal stress UspA family protein
MTESTRPRPVLVGIDGTPAGLEALALGRLLAALLETPLVLGAVYGYEAVDAGEIVWPPRHEADGWLMEAEQQLDASLPWSSIAHAASTRAHGLVDLAEQQHAGVVVLGSSRRASLGRVLAGSTAQRVVHGAPCAVAVAPRGWSAGAALDVIGAAFVEVPEAHAALAMAARIAERAGVPLRTISVVHQPSPAHPMFAATGTSYVGWRVSRRQDAEFCARRALAALDGGVHAEPVVLEGDPLDQLVEASMDLDLLVVGSRRYGPVRSALLGGVSGRLVEKAHCPVLVVPRGAGVAAPAAAPAGAAGERVS